MSNFLKNVSEESAFFLGDKKLLNIMDMKTAIVAMDRDMFRNFVGEDYNHFANWINDVVKDSELASELRTTSDKEETISMINDRLNNLKKKSGDIPEKEKEDKKSEAEKHVELIPYHDHLLEGTKQEVQKNAESKASAEHKSDHDKSKDEHHPEHHDKKEHAAEPKKQEPMHSSRHEHHHEEHHKADQKSHENHSMEEFFKHHHIKFMGKETTAIFFVGVFIGIVVGLIIAKMSTLG
ncbi:MAG: hypothetical protein KKF44_07375 [Nanoarchaeota archaeon]|nr:hypothetical protein [Nanoarchaeota archaeon]